MIKREFKAQIVKNFKDQWIIATAKDERISTKQVIIYYGGPRLDSLSERISGQVVTITENEHKYGTNDFFEKIDNDFVMHPCLFAEINR